MRRLVVTILATIAIAVTAVLACAWAKAVRIFGGEPEWGTHG